MDVPSAGPQGQANLSADQAYADHSGPSGCTAGHWTGRAETAGSEHTMGTDATGRPWSGRREFRFWGKGSGPRLGYRTLQRPDLVAG